jgi:hypothetical protein
VVQFSTAEFSVTEFVTLLMNSLPIAVLGGVFGLDMVSFPQAMIARPLVSATLAGAFVGAPSAGLLIETLPFGASRYAEWGSAGTVGGAVFAAQPAGAPGGLPMGVLAALSVAVLSSSSMVALRKENGRYALMMRGAVDAGSSAAVTAVQVRGLIMDMLLWKIFHTTARAGWLFLVGLAVGVGVLLVTR